MRSLGLLIGLFALSSCVSSEIVYQRSLSASHLSPFARRVPRADFEQIALLLSLRTRQSIIDIHPGLKPDQLVVSTATPDESGFGYFVVEKRGATWQIVSGQDYPVPFA